MKRVVCIGNPYVPGDDLGSRVYQQLIERPRPATVEVIDGGLAGLNLLPCFDHCDRVVFVDALYALDDPNAICVMAAAEISFTGASYGHSAGLGYLLQAERALRGAGPAPEVYVIGASGQAPASLIPTLASLCLQVAENGRPARAKAPDVQS
jgi:hydrogenase maturation protease